MSYYVLNSNTQIKDTQDSLKQLWTQDRMQQMVLQANDQEHYQNQQSNQKPGHFPYFYSY